jgi:hypothetical protein
VQFLSNASGPAIDHRAVRAADMRARQRDRQRSQPAARPLDSFRVQYCPVTGLIMGRDPPAAMSMLIVAICVLLRAPRPAMFCHQDNASQPPSPA